MKLTLLDPSLTTKREQSANVLSAMHDVYILLLTSSNWYLQPQHRAIMQYIQLFKNTLATLIVGDNWQGVLSEPVMKRMNELAEVINTLKAKPAIQPEPILDVPEEFSSVGVLP